MLHEPWGNKSEIKRVYLKKKTTPKLESLNGKKKSNLMFSSIFVRQSVQKLLQRDVKLGDHPYEYYYHVI